MTLEEFRAAMQAALGGGQGMLGGSIVKNPDGSWSQLSTEETLAAQEERRAREEAARAANAANVMTEAATPPPPGVSQTIWNKANSGEFGGFNVTSVTRNPEVRDALIEAGLTDWVKAVYEQHMDSNAAHAIGNGADASAAWGNANNSIGNDWYKDNYGTYSNDTVAGSTGASGAGDFTFGGGTTPTGTEENPYVPPAVDNGGQSGGGSGGDSNGGGSWGGGANVGTAPGGSQSSGYGPGIHNYNATAVSDGPMVNTDIGTASQNAATPWADAYMRASERSQAKGPISGLFARELEQ